MGRPKGSVNKPKEEEPYKPSPVGIPPEKKTLVCGEAGCHHKEDTHYGSPDRWCNVSGCVCVKFLVIN